MNEREGPMSYFDSSLLQIFDAHGFAFRCLFCYMYNIYIYIYIICKGHWMY
jgi:hypothetical protein